MKEYLKNICNADVKFSATKINQTTSRQWKENLMQLLTQELKQNLETQGITIDRVNEGIAITCDNAKIGMITFMADIKVKDLTYDVADAVADYEFELEQKQLKQQQRDKQKQEKIARDTQERELKKKLAEQKRKEREP